MKTPPGKTEERWRPRAGKAKASTLIALSIVSVVLSHLSVGQDSDSYRACNQKAKTQSEMDGCANQEATRLDAELNRIYSNLLSKASAQPEAAAKIETAEKAWIAYRDAYMEAMYPAADKRSEYGSIYPMDADLLRAKLTKQHIADLIEMSQQYGEGKQ